MYLLNVAAGRMSMWPDPPDDFVQWLPANGYSREQEVQGVPLAEEFIPRAVYRDYVQDRLRQAIAATRRTFEQRIAQATRLERDGDVWRVSFGDGSAAARTVAICLGNQPGSLPIPASAIGPNAMDWIITNPWRDPRQASIAPDDRVLVIGTGHGRFRPAA
jgi:uncharacterized NAD(P)/FAD-binding protein YdhS